MPRYAIIVKDIDFRPSWPKQAHFKIEKRRWQMKKRLEEKKEKGKNPGAKRRGGVRNWLLRICRGTDLYFYPIRNKRELAIRGDFPFFATGTRKKGLEHLRVKGCMSAALKWLGYLRDGTDQYDSFLEYFREEVSKGKFSLTDIGTSEEELEQLRVKGCKVAALKWLGYLRSGTDQYDSFLGYFRREVSKGNLSLTVLGTSEEELEQLRVKEGLGRLRTNTNSRKDVVDVFVRILKGNLPFDAVGMSEGELFDRFRKS